LKDNIVSRILLNAVEWCYMFCCCCCCRCDQHTVWWHIESAVVWIHAESRQRIRHANDIHGFKCIWCYTRNSGGWCV